MKIDYRTPRETADISARKGSDLLEFGKLAALTVLLCVVLYFLLGLAVDFAVTRISVEREQRLFADFPDLPSRRMTAEEQAQLLPLFERLQTGPGVQPLEYQLLVLDQEEPNAFAFPGGTIGVSAGLLLAVEGDIELAFVLAHELGHFHNRDHLRGMGRALGIGILSAVLFGNDVSALTGIPVLVMGSRYSRKQETRADEFALELIHEEFGTTEGFDRLFRQLDKKREDPDWVEMLSTHPLPARRIEHLRGYAELHFQQ